MRPTESSNSLGFHEAETNKARIEAIQAFINKRLLEVDCVPEAIIELVYVLRLTHMTDEQLAG
jgi:hypothetical protein